MMASPAWKLVVATALALCSPVYAAFNCVPDVPPKASLITISAPDASGDSTVTAAPGAVPGGSLVVLITLNSGHSASVTAASDGSFTTTLFAPPGVSVLVKAGNPSKLSSPSMFNCFPATIIGAGEPPAGSSGLAVVGAGITNFNFALPAWTFQGEISARKFAPGGTLRLTGKLSIASQALQSAGPMTLGAQIFLERLSGPDGTGALGQNTFASIFMTPTGFPIERESALDNSKSKTFPIAKSDPTHAAAAVDYSYTLPGDLLEGYYRPYVYMYFVGVPELAVQPSPYNSQSNGLFNVGSSFRLPGPQVSLLLPIVQVGNPKPPRLFWSLLTDDLSNGTRGTTAREDQSSFGVASRIVTQSDTYIVPRSDPATGTPISYRLEPFALTVSVSNGSTPMPSIPIVPFCFPSGHLTVKVQQPDGTAISIGPAPFLQSRSRVLAHSAGQEIDPGGGHIQDAYQLSTMDPRFEISFTQDGHHVISFEGSIDDIYGNTWSGSGTYDVYVARPLSLDTAVLPGTPFEVGDVLAPGVVVMPPAAASVQVRTRLMPNSDPSALSDTTVSGRANDFGYFHPPGNGIKMDQAGEYRVDVTASFVDNDGQLWMGSRTWGGVVAPKNPTIIAHGQRGTDMQDLAGTQWFFRTQTGFATPGPDHIRFPFNSGDVAWAQQEDAVTPPVTFQDPSGSLLTLLRSRPIQGHPELLALGQTPLYLSRPDGQEPHLNPSKIDIFGYGYSSVQRPMVRVREEVLGGNTASPYWRFAFVNYAGQLGASANGDLPNMFKFQYGGVVLRGSGVPRPQYAIYGSLFVLVANDDLLGGSRVFPPFQGNGGGPNGGPVMTLKGRAIDMFFHPTLVRPGSVLVTGDTFALAGAVAPTFPGLVSYTVTTPSGGTQHFSGKANKVGYYYHPEHDFTVTEPGVYNVDLKVTYDGQTSAGQLTAPFPSGDVLGTPDGRFYFYVTPAGSAPLSTNLPASLPVNTVNYSPAITVPSNSGHVTAVLPGFVLDSRAIAGSNGKFTYQYNPRTFSLDFPMSGNQSVFAADLITITLFDSASNSARVVGINGATLLHNLQAGVLSCDYALNVSGQAFTASGGTGVITITTSAGCPWTVGTLPAGITLTSAGSGVGTGVVTFQVAANAGGYTARSFTIAGRNFTIEQSAFSIPGLAAVGSLGQVASEGTWDFTLDAINLGSSAATARFTFADNSGSPLALPLKFPQLTLTDGPLLAATLDRALNPNAQIVMDSTGPDNAATLVGSGQVLSNGNVSGFGIFSNPKVHWNAVVPLETRNANKYFLAFDNTAPITTGVAVASLSGQAQNVPAIIRDDKGTQIGNPTIPLSAFGHTSFMLNDPQAGFPVTNGKRGSIEFDTPPGGQLSVLGLRASGAALTTLPVLANVGTSGGSITHVALNGGWTSVFYLVNTGNASAQLTLSFFDESGIALPVPLVLPQSVTNITTAALTQTLAAGAVLVVETQAQDAQALVIGSAQLTTTGNISGFEIFRWTTFGQEASVPLETRTPNSFVLVFDDTNGLTTGVALANLIATTANVTVRIYDDAGALLQTTSINLASGGHRSFMLPDNYAVTANKRGMVEFVVPQGAKISAIGLRAKSDGTLTTIPVLTK